MIDTLMDDRPAISAGIVTRDAAVLLVHAGSRRVLCHGNSQPVRRSRAKRSKTPQHARLSRKPVSR